MPRLRLAGLGGRYNRVLAVYDEVTGGLVLAEPDTGAVLPLSLNTIYDTVREMKDRITGRAEQQEKPARLLTDFAQDNKLLFFTPGGRTIQLVNLEEGSVYKMDFPFVLKSLHPLDESRYLVVKDVQATEERLKHYKPKETTNLFLLKKGEATDPLPTVLNPIHQSTDITSVISLEKKGLSDFGLKASLGEATSSPNTLFTTDHSYANIALGFPELEFSASEVYSWPRQAAGPAPARPAAARTARIQAEPGRDQV